MSEEKKAPAFDMNSDTMSGFEQINNSTMSVPFIRLLQSLSPQVQKMKPEFIQGAEAGLFFNTITKEIYGSEFKCIVLHFERIFIEWLPERGGFVGYHTPENAEQLAIDKTFGKWKTKDGNLLQEAYVYMALVIGHEKEGPVVLSFNSSAIKTAREWNRLMTTHVMDNGKKALPYYLVWKVAVDYKSNEKGDWYVPKVSFFDYIDEQQYALTKQERIALPDKTIDYAAAIEDKTSSVDEADTPF